MLFGIFEELGELVEAVGLAMPENVVLDAVADLMIYTASYCNHKNWDMQEIWDSRAEQSAILRGYSTPLPKMADFVTTIAKLSHHHLKAEQKIRGGAEHHNDKAKRWLGHLLWAAETYVSREIANPNLPRVACDVWRLEVQPREWKREGESEPERFRDDEEAAPEELTSDPQ